MSQIYGTSLDPINRVAAFTGRSGSRYLPAGKIGCWHGPTPPNMHKKVPPECGTDLIDVEYGRFRVVGLMIRNHSSGQPAKWVVRCACGDYETRSAKAIRNPNNQNDMCHICRHKAQEVRTYEHHAGKMMKSS